MSRYIAQVIVLASAVLLAGGTSAMAQASKTAKRPAAPPASPLGEGPRLALPGYWALSLGPVQKELELTDEQKRKLWEVSDMFQAKVLEINDMLEKLPPEEQKVESESLRGQARKDMDAVRKQVAEVLTRQQLQAYQKIDFRLRVSAALVNAQLLKSLKLTDQQRVKLRQVRDDTEQKVHELQGQAADQTLEILTAPQRQKLEEELDKQGW
jgi:Spy/CpxP family protein refolding chaperone